MSGPGCIGGDQAESEPCNATGRRQEPRHLRRRHGRDRRRHSDANTPEQRVHLHPIAEYAEADCLVDDPSGNDDRQCGGKRQHGASQGRKRRERCGARKCEARQHARQKDRTTAQRARRPVLASASKRLDGASYRAARRSPFFANRGFLRMTAKFSSHAGQAVQGCSSSGSTAST